jgi:hypothetical protein
MQRCSSGLYLSYQAVIDIGFLVQFVAEMDLIYGEMAPILLNQISVRAGTSFALR